MYINEFKAALPFLMKANIVPFAWGPHGIGKTAAVHQFAEEGGHKAFTLALGNVEIPDILGVMDRKVDQYTGATTSSTYLMPEFFHDLIQFARANPDKYAILFLDELNHARKDVLSPVFQMITGRSIHTTKFPDNFRIIAASNPPTDDYAGVLNLRNQALLDRFCHLNIQPSHKGWLEYADGIKVNEDIVGFIRENPDHLRCAGADFSSDKLAKPSERSWEWVDRLYRVGAPKELIYGMVGTASGVAFYAWMEQQRAKCISGADIMEYKPETRKRVLKLVKDGNWAEVQKAVDALRDEAAKRTKQLHEENEANKGCNDGLAPREVIDAVSMFLLDLPDEVFMSANHLLWPVECRYLAMTVFNEDKVFEHFTKVMDTQAKKAEAVDETPAKKTKKK